MNKTKTIISPQMLVGHTVTTNWLGDVIIDHIGKINNKWILFDKNNRPIMNLVKEELECLIVYGSLVYGPSINDDYEPFELDDKRIPTLDEYMASKHD